MVSILAWVCAAVLLCFLFFFFNDTATTEIYTLSLHDALPICPFQRRDVLVECHLENGRFEFVDWAKRAAGGVCKLAVRRSEEHTSELQSQSNLVCRLLLEKKKNRSTSFDNRLNAPHSYNRLLC